MSYQSGLDLNSAQLRRLASLAKDDPSCRVVGYRFWDASMKNIVPIIEYSSGARAELRPNGRINVISSNGGMPE